jgi:hypothetical protein
MDQQPGTGATRCPEPEPDKVPGANLGPGGERERLSRSGKAVRLVVTAAFGGLLLAGTLVGQDDAFPFGPFRMYATTDSLDAPVKSTRMEAVDSAGHRFALTGAAVGLRRAEIEGQMDRFRTDPDLLGAVAAAYRNRHPDGRQLARIEIITRHFALKRGRPTGYYDDTVDVWWTPRGAHR